MHCIFAEIKLGKHTSREVKILIWPVKHSYSFLGSYGEASCKMLYTGDNNFQATFFGDTLSSLIPNTLDLNNMLFNTQLIDKQTLEWMLSRLCPHWSINCQQCTQHSYNVFLRCTPALECWRPRMSISSFGMMLLTVCCLLSSPRYPSHM